MWPARKNFGTAESKLRAFGVLANRESCARVMKRSRQEQRTKNNRRGKQISSLFVALRLEFVFWDLANHGTKPLKTKKGGEGTRLRPLGSFAHEIRPLGLYAA